MDILKSIAVDITHSVFDNDIVASTKKYKVLLNLTGRRGFGANYLLKCFERFKMWGEITGHSR